MSQPTNPQTKPYSQTAPPRAHHRTNPPTCNPTTVSLPPQHNQPNNPNRQPAPVTPPGNPYKADLPILLFAVRLTSYLFGHGHGCAQADRGYVRCPLAVRHRTQPTIQPASRPASQPANPPTIQTTNQSGPTIQSILQSDGRPCTQASQGAAGWGPMKPLDITPHRQRANPPTYKPKQKHKAINAPIHKPTNGSPLQLASQSSHHPANPATHRPVNPPAN